MRKRWWAIAASTAALAVPVVVSTGTAFGANPAPATATVNIVGVETFRPNFVQNTWRFPLEKPTSIRSGGLLTFHNLTTDPHSMSVVAVKDLPTSFKGNAVVGALFAAHFPGPTTTNPFIDDGVPVSVTSTPDWHEKSHSNPTGPPTLGDSVLIDTTSPVNGHGFPPFTTVKVNAPAGTVLHYFCIFHNWMQGAVAVG